MILNFKSVVLILVAIAVAGLLWFLWTPSHVERWWQVSGDYSKNYGDIGVFSDISLKAAAEECENNPECKGFVFAPTLNKDNGIAYMKSAIEMGMPNEYPYPDTFTVCKDDVNCGPNAKKLRKFLVPKPKSFQTRAFVEQIPADQEPQQPPTFNPPPIEPQPNEPPPFNPLPPTPIPIAPGSCPDPGCDVIVNEHNQMRAAHGVYNALRWDSGLQAIAQERVNWNAQHGGTGHDAFYALIARQGIGAGPENAWGALNFAGAASAWANSAGHAPHVLGRNVTAVGCATRPDAGPLMSICVYDAWGQI